LACFIQKQFPEGRLVEIVSNGLGTFIWIIGRKNEVLREARLYIKLAFDVNSAKLVEWRTIIIMLALLAEALEKVALLRRLRIATIPK
jgi:hypothetical protein